MLAHDLITGCALENAADLVFILDSESRITVCNEEFVKFIGLDREEIIGKSLNRLLPEDLGEQFREIEQRVRTTGGKFRFELVLRSLFGSSLECDVVITSCAKYNTLLYVFRDIYEHNRILKSLMKRDKLLYDLSCGTQKILYNSNDFEHALESALEKFCIGTEVDAVIMAQTASPKDCGYNVGHEASLYRVNKWWSSCCKLDKFQDSFF